MPVSLAWETTRAPGELFTLRQEWVNRNVSWCPQTFRLKVYLLDSGGRAAFTAVDPRFDPRSWVQGQTYSVVSSLNLPTSLPVGVYQLCIALADESGARASGWAFRGEDVQLGAECQTRMIADTPPTEQELFRRFPMIAARIELAELAVRVERESRSTRDTKATEKTGPKAKVGPAWPVGQPPARYQIRKVLGRGGMGTVYRAYDTQLDREVALKVPCIDPSDDPAVRERFFREAKAVARICHPNVCQIFDAGESDGCYFIAMALIEGQSLAARLQQGSLDCQRAAELVKQPLRPSPQLPKSFS